MLAALAATGTNLLADLVLIRKGTTESREFFLGLRASTADDVPAPAATGEEKHGPMTAYGFTQEFEGRLTGDSALLECRLTERVDHSGPRLIERPTAYGRDLIQAGGYASGRRVITATAVSASEMAARLWVESQKDLAFFQRSGGADHPSLAPAFVHHRQERRTAHGAGVTRRDVQRPVDAGGGGVRRNPAGLGLCADDTGAVRWGAVFSGVVFSFQCGGGAGGCCGMQH